LATGKNNLFDGNETDVVAKILKALSFAAKKHSSQRRKDREASPYINHLIEIADVLVGVGRVAEVTTLQGAILHDTIEDTETTADELDRAFGREVRCLVQEVTDDKGLLKSERKRLQIQHAPHLSTRAKLVKIADKICNVRDVTHSPPAGWTLERRQEYLEWSERVVAGCRGCNESLENLYDKTLGEARQVLSQETHRS
jgi:guanosine-3',5'-bis(diphosphate) 3'-pyrophosphohydrolase